MTLSVSFCHSFTELECNITFENGRDLGVLFGYSGAGKSVTLQMISGLMRPRTGRICLGDRVLFDSERGIDLAPGARRIGFVFQENMLFPHMRVRENILFGGRALSDDKRREKMLALAHRFQLENVLEHFPEAISGGQKKRVALAMVLMGEPELLLLDEPFSALDNPLRLRMRECLSGVMKHLDIPVLLVTHDLLEALHVGDTMHLISQGRVVQSGSPSQMVKNPTSPEMAELLQLPTLPLSLAKFAARNSET